MKNLLVPFDFSEVSLNALNYAVKFAKGEQKMNIYLLYITAKDIKVNERELQEKFQNITKEKKGVGKLEMNLIIKSGNFTSTIVDVYKDREIDLVIMGTKGFEEGEESEFTKTSKLVLEADIPVLVIPGDHKFFRLNKIFLALGEDIMHDNSTLNILLDVSRSFNAKVDVLTVSRTPESVGYSREDEANENTLQYYLEKFYSHHSFAENEDILEEIDNYIRKNDMDMLAIMPKTHSKDSTPSKGKLAREVTLKSNIPVLILD